MPFQSQAQQRFMYSQKPELAKEFQSKTPQNESLPERVAPAPQKQSITPDRKKMAMQSMVAKYGKA